MNRQYLEDWSGLSAIDPTEFIAALKGENGEYFSDDDLLAGLTQLKEIEGKRMGRFAKERYNRGIREKGNSFENAVREALGFETDQKGDEFIAALKAHVESVSTPAEPEGKKLDEYTQDELEALPAFKSLLSSRSKELAREALELKDEAYKNLEGEFDAYKKKAFIEQNQGKLKEQVLAELTNYKARLYDSGVDEDKKKEQIEQRLAQFMQLPSLNIEKFRFSEDGKAYPVDKDGNQLEDDKSFQTITLRDYVRRNWIHGVHNTDPDKGSPSLKTKKPGDSTTRVTLEKGANVDQLLAQAKTPADRIAILDAAIAQAENN